MPTPRGWAGSRILPRRLCSHTRISSASRQHRFIWTFSKIWIGFVQFFFASSRSWMVFFLFEGGWSRVFDPFFFIWSLFFNWAWQFVWIYVIFFTENSRIKTLNETLNLSKVTLSLKFVIFQNEQELDGIPQGPRRAAKMGTNGGDSKITRRCSAWGSSPILATQPTFLRCPTHPPAWHVFRFCCPQELKVVRPQPVSLLLWLPRKFQKCLKHRPFLLFLPSRKDKRHFLQSHSHCDYKIWGMWASDWQTLSRMAGFRCLLRKLGPVNDQFRKIKELSKQPCERVQTRAFWRKVTLS